MLVVITLTVAAVAYLIRYSGWLIRWRCPASQDVTMHVADEAIHVTHMSLRRDAIGTRRMQVPHGTKCRYEAGRLALTPRRGRGQGPHYAISRQKGYGTP